MDIMGLKLAVETLQTQIPGLVRRAIREEREEQSKREIVGCEEIAEMLGARAGSCSLAELGRKRLARDPELRALAISGGDGRAQYRFLRRDVEALMALRRQERMKARKR